MYIDIWPPKKKEIINGKTTPKATTKTIIDLEAIDMIESSGTSEPCKKFIHVEAVR